MMLVPKCPQCGLTQPPEKENELHLEDCPLHDEDLCEACDAEEDAAVGVEEGKK